MSGIFGIVRRDGAAVDLQMMASMREAMALWGRDGSKVVVDGCAGLGQTLTISTYEEGLEKLPVVDDASGVIFTAEGRVDNREDLLRDLEMPTANGDPSCSPDGEVMLRAYQRWGALSPSRLFGDWSFAAWDPTRRQLFLARDHLGNTSLYYYADARIFAFASSLDALLALDLGHGEMDEFFLAQVLVSWPAYHGGRTIRKHIRRLPPAHILTVAGSRLDIRQFWRLEDTPELRLRDRQEYVVGFREIFGRAVRDRLRAPPSRVPGTSPVGATLSGGLDSGSVVATAATILRASGSRLNTFTSVPIWEAEPYSGTRFGDELPLAKATASLAGNVDLHVVTADSITPMEGIRLMLRSRNEPAHAGANAYWIQSLLTNARAAGCSALLTGQMGNAGISWTGSVRSLPIQLQLRRLGPDRFVKDMAWRHAPQRIMRSLAHMRASEDEWLRGSAIRPEFARRLDLWNRMWSASDSIFVRRSDDPHAARCRILQPGRSALGGLWAEDSAANHVDIRDPTADARVLEYTFSVPDRVFVDSGSGLDRWLIREAMVGTLPDDVRLNRRRGLQAADLVPRLRASAAEVEIALAELASGPAAEYLDLTHMRDVWRSIQSDNSFRSYRWAVSVLARGIHAGWFINHFSDADGKARDL